MKTKVLMFALLFSSPIVAAADPIASSASPATGVQVSTAVPSVIDTGETKSLPMPTGITEHPGVFVTLTRTALSDKDLPTSTDIVGTREIEAYDAQNAGEAIARQTGIQTLPIGRLGSLLTADIRGSKSNQTLVLIDGRPQGGVALSNDQDLSEIPVEQIDHIEILRGGASALYGPNAIGGVINVITKRAAYNGLPLSHVSYETGSYGQQVYRLDFGSRMGRFDYFFFGDQQRESGFRDNSDATVHNIGGNVGLSMGSGGKLLFDIASYHANAGVPGYACGPSDPACQNFPTDYLQPNEFNNKVEKISSEPTARQVTDTNYVRTSYILPLPDDSILTLRAFGSEREAVFDDSNDAISYNAASTDSHQQSKGGEMQLSLPYGLVTGANFIRDREDNADQLDPTNSFTRSVENWGVFAEENFRWKELSVVPSGRFDHNSVAGDSKNPRVQVMDDTTSWLRFSGSAGRSFRAPTIDDLYYVINGAYPYHGNPNLQPETAWTYDAGFEVHEDSISLKATYFRANINNLIQLNPITFDTVVNIGSARRQGMELELKHVLSEYFRDSWNYTYLDNRGIPSGGDHYVTLANSPRDTANWTGTYTPAKNWTIDNILRYVGSSFAGNGDTGDKIGSRFLWDERVTYQWRQLSLFIGVSDITNKRYVEQDGFPLPGTTAYGGIKLRLWG